MIERINAHNRLNGVIFSTVEFALIALVVAPFAIYYVLNAQIIMAAISVGILLNCLVIVTFGLRSWLVGGKEANAGGLRAILRSKADRAKLAAEYPNMGTDTIILVVTLLIPFALLILTLYEFVTTGLSGR